ncbi:MAG TPA: hypothetical protein VLV83_00470 [Acidobacteriota bacterium]|nr:hypothetical protein [Acidobacteriota bacterium]
MVRSFQFSTSFGLGSRPLEEMRRAYDPILRNQFDHYLKGTRRQCEQVIDELWKSLDDEPSLPPAATESQFVLHLISRFLRLGGARPPADSSARLERIQVLLEGLSIYQRKCAFLLLSGYPKDWAGSMLNVGTVQIYNTLQELQGRCGGQLPSLEAADKAALREAAPADPEALGRFESLIEGVIHWEDKQQLEARIAERLELLETLVMLEEIRHFLARDRDRDRQS